MRIQPGVYAVEFFNPSPHNDVRTIEIYQVWNDREGLPVVIEDNSGNLYNWRHVISIIKKSNG